MYFKGIKNILIIKLRHIGDVLLALPTIRAVRERFPDAYIAVFINKGTEDILTRNPLIDDIFVYDRELKSLPLLKKMRGETNLMRSIRKKGFDMVIDLTGGDRPAILSFLCGAKHRIARDPCGKGFWGKKYLYTRLIKPSDNMMHSVMKDMEIVRELGMDTDNRKIEIEIGEKEDSYVEGLLKEKGLEHGEPFVHIHPTSRWFFKCWSMKNMASIIDYIEESGIRVVMTSSPDGREIEKIRDIERLTISFPVNIAGRLSLKGLAAVSKRAMLFFGVDSAPMHIAAAMGTPVIALFGPTGAFNWGPWNNYSRTGFYAATPYPGRNGIQKSGMHTVIQREWDCIPCGRDGCNGSKKSRCLEDITPDEVIEVIRLESEMILTE
ncbi:MAG: putative lipopolysaccharide heptosyltransferase III [Nitrospirota bacterium]